MAQASVSQGQVQILDTLSRIRDELPTALRRLAAYILEHPREVAHSNLTDISRDAGVGEASIVRLAKKLGFTGYHDFKIAFAMEYAGKASAEKPQILDDTIVDTDGADVIALKVKNTVNFAIDENINGLNIEAMNKVTEAILKARKVVFYGMGNSALSAIYLKNKLARIGLNTVQEMFTHFMYTTASLLGPEDVVVFSHKGRTAESIKAMKIAREAGAVCVAVTNQLASPLARLADLSIFNGNRERYLQGDSLATIASQLHICEIIYSMVVNHNTLKAAKTKQITIEAIERSLVPED